MDWSAHLDAAVASGLLAGLAGLAVPRLVAAVPEPEPAPEPVPELEPVPGIEPASRAGASSGLAEPEPPKELYVEIARRPGLGRRTALVALAAGGLLGAELGWAWPLVYLLPLVPLLVALSVIDLRTRLLPTRLITPCYAVAVLGVGVTWLATRDTPDLIRAGAGWLVAGLVFFVLWFAYPRGMGYGDVRLSGVLGLVLGSLGWGQLFVGLYAGFLLFGLPGLLLAVLRRDRALLRSAYPFGPFMILGALLGVLWGQPLWAGLAGG